MKKLGDFLLEKIKKTERLSKVISSQTVDLGDYYTKEEVNQLLDEFSTGGGGGSVLLATTYDKDATEGILICTQYDPEA